MEVERWLSYRRVLNCRYTLKEEQRGLPAGLGMGCKGKRHLTPPFARMELTSSNMKKARTDLSREKDQKFGFEYVEFEASIGEKSKLEKC